MPLKALANDQMAAIKRLLTLAGMCADAAEATDPPALPKATVDRLRRMSQLSVGTYDGDTPQEERAALRNRCVCAAAAGSSADRIRAG